MVGSTEDRGHVLVVDNGAGWIKAERASADRPRCFPNAAIKSRAEAFTRYGEFSTSAKDVSGLTLRRPHERGYLNQIDLEKDIWSAVFRSKLKVDPKESGLLLTEPLLNLQACQSMTEQVVFEDFGFRSYYSCPAPLLAARHHFSRNPKSDACLAGAGLVLDLGFSFTHAVPIFDNRVVNYGIRRLDFGGKAATNLLKEVVSHRSMNVMSEPHMVEIIKEEACFVSQDSAADLRKAQSSRDAFTTEYVLPDGITVFRPHVRKAPDAQAAAMERGPGAPKSRQGPQILRVAHERFMVPEVYFHPSDVGLNQAGIAEIVVQSLEAIDPLLWPVLLSNVLVIGGSSMIPGLVERFRQELRKTCPIDCPLSVTHSQELAQTSAWHGGKVLVSSGEYRAMAVTRQEYMDHGCDPKRRKLLS